jgi:hypothetical protein
VPRGQETLFGPTEGLVRRTRRSTDALLSTLRHAGSLEDRDVALVALLRTLADLIDHELCNPDPNKWTVSTLAARWLDVHQLLRGPTHPGIDAELEAFFHGETGGGPPVRDSPQP